MLSGLKESEAPMISESENEGNQNIMVNAKMQ